MYDKSFYVKGKCLYKLLLPYINTLFYGWMCWVAILNPSKENFIKIKELLKEIFCYVKTKHEKKLVKAK